jgi:hypothetical protein
MEFCLSFIAGGRNETTFLANYWTLGINNVTFNGDLSIPVDFESSGCTEHYQNGQFTQQPNEMFVFVQSPFVLCPKVVKSGQLIINFPVELYPNPLNYSSIEVYMSNNDSASFTLRKQRRFVDFH